MPGRFILALGKCLSKKDMFYRWCSTSCFCFISSYHSHIYPPDFLKSDKGAIHRVSNYSDLLPEMPKYYNENNVPPAQQRKTPLSHKGILAVVPICLPHRVSYHGYGLRQAKPCSSHYKHIVRMVKSINKQVPTDLFCPY